MKNFRTICLMVMILCPLILAASDDSDDSEIARGGGGRGGGGRVGGGAVGRPGVGGVGAGIGRPGVGVGGINRTPALGRPGVAAAAGYRAGVNQGAAYGGYGYSNYYPTQPYYNSTQSTYPYYQAPVTPYALPNYNPV